MNPHQREEPRQRRFAQEFARDGNATQAAIRAGYSAKSAGSIGSGLLKKSHVARMVSEEQDRYRENTLKVGNDVHRQAARIAWADVRKLFDEHDKLRPVSQWPNDVAAAVAGCDVVTKRSRTTRTKDGETEVEVVEQEFVRKVRLEPKRPALELLAKMLGVIKPHGSADESEDIDLDNLTDEELTTWDTLVRKALGKRATQLLSNLGDEREPPTKH